MIYIPRSPAECGPNFVALLAADHQRRREAEEIFARLEPDGALGERARSYIVLNQLRRSTFRAILCVNGLPIPGWAEEGSKGTRLRAKMAGVPAVAD